VIETRDPEVINSVLTSFTLENEALVNLLFQLQYYFRGALSRDDVWAMSPAERDIAIRFLEKRFKDAEKAQKTGLHQFL